MIFSLILNLPKRQDFECIFLSHVYKNVFKRVAWQLNQYCFKKIIFIFLFYLFNSKSIYQAPFRAKNVAFFCDTPSLQLYITSTIYVCLVKLDHRKRYFCITQTTRLNVFFCLMCTKLYLNELHDN
jgi:hypothetical protein